MTRPEEINGEIVVGVCQVYCQCCVVRVPTCPGKPGILSFSFLGLENAWNLIKK